MRIAILIPVTSRRRALRGPEDTDLVRQFLPSFLATADWDGAFSYDLHVGVDDDDAFYADPVQQASLLDAVRRALGNRPARVVAHVLAGTAHAPCWSWNALFARALEDGADFFYQMGDDVRLATHGWARDFSAVLLANPVVPGLGVAGPLETVARTILTQAFVSRRHAEIFGTFYPPVFRNWWSDDWITNVYRPGHLFFREQHLVENVGGAERYEIDRSAEAILGREVEAGRLRLSAWLAARAGR